MGLIQFRRAELRRSSEPSLLLVRAFRYRLGPLLLLLPFLAPAQDKGIHFEDTLSWPAIQARASAGNKYILMDCYTTWCGPCRYMSTVIFPQPEAGEYINKRFVSVSVQLDTTTHDNTHVRSWYADAHALATEYHVDVYPTFLIFAPDGRPVQRLIGSKATAQEFLGEVRTAFDTSKQYYSRLQEFRDGRRDTPFLRRLALQADRVYDKENGRQVAAAYLAVKVNPYSRTALEVLMTYTEKSSDSTFPFILAHSAKIDSVLGVGAAEQEIGTILVQEYVAPRLLAARGFEPDWKGANHVLAAKFPEWADEVTERGKLNYYRQRGDWGRFQKTIVPFMQQYGPHATPDELNLYAWTILMNCRDKACVTRALEWSKRSVDLYPSPEFMDTYANLLYKLGHQEEALTWEQKALAAADAPARIAIEKNLQKMRGPAPPPLH